MPYSCCGLRWRFCSFYSLLLLTLCVYFYKCSVFVLCHGFWFSIHLAEEKRVHSFITVAVWVLCLCSSGCNGLICSLRLWHFLVVYFRVECYQFLCVLLLIKFYADFFEIYKCFTNILRMVWRCACFFVFFSFFFFFFFGGGGGERGVFNI